MLPSLQPYEIGTSELDPFIAVGTGITPRPPHGSVQALLRHRALTLTDFYAMKLDRVLTVAKYHDAPRLGVAELNGVPHIYESEFV